MLDFAPAELSSWDAYSWPLPDTWDWENGLKKSIQTFHKVRKTFGCEEATEPW
ncbi:hypothetical protein M404DRAFT_1006410 [Pisolithus tinctorius Marx 270]|uniref:Uncharacterized protein n=1 Tax=Pisolithus tinctorius Marx 270 TaxID=870435 RepID=A0A0C3NMS9_PISTI|nr:hypothetical protein M404DRAFT_1006410 [Pisolithus tinctorius Marx 270]